MITCMEKRKAEGDLILRHRGEKAMWRDRIHTYAPHTHANIPQTRTHTHILRVVTVPLDSSCQENYMR